MRVLAIICLVVMMVGCKSSEQKLIDVCMSALNDRLVSRAKYDGWSIKKAEAKLLPMAPDVELNDKFNTEQFWTFEVLINNFTMKNGFNASVKSTSSCTGYVSKDKDGKYDPPSIVEIKVNGERYGSFLVKNKWR